MGQRLIYLDASAIIRLVEGPPELLKNIRDAIGSQRVTTSVLSITECLTGPMRASQQLLIDRYQAFFSGDDLSMIDVDPEIARLAAHIRSRYRLKTSDAIHYATAVDATAMSL